MKGFLNQYKFILMEAAVVERLRRLSGIELDPRLANATLIYNTLGRQALKKIYQSYIDIAKNSTLPLLLCSPTWRANIKRVFESNIHRNINIDAINFMHELRNNQENNCSKIKIGGLIGCKDVNQDNIAPITAQGRLPSVILIFNAPCFLIST